MSEPREAAFLKRLRKMEPEAWRQFVSDHSRLLAGFVRHVMGFEAGHCEEVVQMVFVRCVRSIRTFDPDRGSLFDWLRAVARNEARTLLRQDRRRSRERASSTLAPELAEQLALAMDSRPLPSEMAARRDVRAAVHDVLGRLNGDYRSALVMKYVDGLTVSQIARCRGLSDKAAESLLTRSRDAFRKAFTARVGDRTRKPESTP
jgi:RNA polymerase sigma-70 factor (ECF subfamily)